jgi:hypothetical protein
MYKHQGHTRSINNCHNLRRVQALMVSRSKTLDTALGVQVGRGTQCRLRAKSAFRESVNGNGIAR